MGLCVFVSHLLFSYPCVCFHSSGTFRSLRQLIQQLLCHYNRPLETESAVQVRDAGEPSSTLKREGNAMEIEPTTQSHSAFGQSVDILTVLNSDSISGELSPRRKGVITVKECATF